MEPDAPTIVVHALWQEFRGAEAAHLDPDTPVVVLAWARSDGTQAEHAVSLDDARRLVAEVCAALATHGDPLAREIGERHLSGAPEDTTHG